MSIAFVDRPPTSLEFERFRLLLSTYQDGSGMLAVKGSAATLPGWRDFERSFAAAFSGVNQENKSIFDVLLPLSSVRPMYAGVSCKMRAELRRFDRDGRVTIELSNSSKKFNDFLASKGIKQNALRKFPQLAGSALIEVIESWKAVVSTDQGGVIDIAKSSYLSLLYDRKQGDYQLFWFGSNLPDPNTIKWYYPTLKGKRHAGHLNGDDASGRLFEWYAESGGQLKYYPLGSGARWISHRFKLEPIIEDHQSSVLVRKAEVYFADKWRVLTA